MTDLSTQPGDSADGGLKAGFRIRGYTVLPDQRQIVSPDGRPVSIEGRIMDVLVELARTPHQRVTYNHFMATVWADTIVETGVLHTAVARLRKVFNDDPKVPRFIANYPRIGYELIADVEPLEQPAAPAIIATPTRVARFRNRDRLAIVTLALLIVGAFAWFQVSDGPAKIAVIPFSAPEEDERLPLGGVGLADHLISALTNSSDLRVVARRDSFALPGTSMTVESIANTLDADYLIGGEIALHGDGVTVTVTLTDTVSNADIWTGMIEGRSNNLARLNQDTLAALTKALEAKLDIQSLPAQALATESRDEAYQRYLEAQKQWHLRGAPRIDLSIQLLREATSLRPEFPEAHLALAQALAIRPHYVPEEPLGPAYRQARERLNTVRGLTDELNSEVMALEGSMLMEEHRWEAAQSFLEQALTLKPDNAMANYWYSYLLSRFGRYTDALHYIREAARLNPYSAVINNRLALAYLWVNDNEQGARQFEIASDLGYLDTTEVKIAALNAVRNERWEYLRELLLLAGYRSTWIDPFILGLKDPAYRPDAIPLIEQAISGGEISRDSHFGIWYLYQDADRAFAAFNPGEKTEDIEILWADDAAFLREDPRFPDLVASVGLTGFVDWP